MYAVVLLHRQEPVLRQGQGFPFGRAHARQERVRLLMFSLAILALLLTQQACMHRRVAY